MSAMRWLVLHARSRQVPAALVAVLVVASPVWWWARQVEPGSVLPTVVLLTAGVAVLSIGLGSPDAALDRTAAFRWPARRIGLVGLIGLIAGAIVPAAIVLAASGGSPPYVVVGRDAAGMCGLAALAAAVFGGPYAWTLPLGWLAVAVFLPTYPDAPAVIATWMLRPADTPVATWTAAVLAVVGTMIYAVFGPRR